MVEFITFAREQRLPMSSNILQTRALDTARQLGINDFKVSNGLFNRFLHRSPIQTSFKLHEKGNSALPTCRTERTNKIRDICKEYNVTNIYNMDKSGIFYRMGPRQTYLSASETRDTVRGTEFGKHKERVTIVFSCNADGSHLLPIF